MIELKNISHSYDGTEVLRDISTQIKEGKITAVIGRTGSGKSTLVEIIAGITASSAGEALYNGRPVSECRGDIGMVFQYPENQLFADTVYEDIAYGPENFGINGAELDKRVKDIVKETGLGEEKLDMSPFELSGGEKRLAAIAGILVMSHEVLLLDEPAAGLDPSRRERLFDILNNRLSAKPDMTIVFVTHSMEDAAEYADEVIVLNDGVLAAHKPAREVFYDDGLLSCCGLDIPETVKLRRELAAMGIDIGDVLTLDEASHAVSRFLKGGGADAS